MKLDTAMKKSGLVGGGADPKTVAAMPAMPQVPAPAAPVAEAPPVAAPAPAPIPAPAQAGELVVEIPLNAIRRSPFQVRAMGDDAYIEELMASIADSKLISPIVVRPISADKTSNIEVFEFIAGEHRAAAHRRLGHTTIKAIVRQMSDADAAKALSADNAVRKGLDDYDRFKHARMLLDNGFCRTRREVGATMRLKEQQIGMLLGGFDPMPEEARALLEKHEGLLGMAAAYELRDLTREYPAMVAQALALVVSGKLKQTGIRGHIEAQLRPARQRPDRQTIKIQRTGYPDIDLVVSGDQVVIKAAGIDADELGKVIKANLDKLLPVT